MSDTTPQRGHDRSESSFVQLDLASVVQSHRKAHSLAQVPRSRVAGSQNVLNGLESTSMKPPPLAKSSAAPGHARRPATATSAEGESIATLKRRLAEAESEVASLKEQQSSKTLSSNEYKVLEQQFAAQETLLSGYQRECERNMEELITLKKWKKHAELHLQRLYGDNYQAELGAENPIRRLGTPLNTNFASPRLQTPSPLKPPNSSPAVVNEVEPGCVGEPVAESPAVEVAPLATLPPGLDASALLAQLESVKLLVMEQERRFLQKAADLEMRERNS